MGERLQDLLRALRAQHVHEMSNKERWLFQESWRRAFAPGCKDWSGPLRDTDWHVFSYGHASALQGFRASATFDALTYESPLILGTSLASGPVVSCELPASATYGWIRNHHFGDLYITDVDLSWTFVLTHEESCGPYFAVSAGGAAAKRRTELLGRLLWTHPDDTDT